MIRKPVFLVLFILLTACGSISDADLQATIAAGIEQTRAAEPTATPTPEPTPDIQATISAGVAATQAAQPFETQPIAEEADYSEFFTKFREQFDKSKPSMSTPVNANLADVYFDTTESGSNALWVITSSGEEEITGNLIGFCIGVLRFLVDEPVKPEDYYPKNLPEDLAQVHFIFKDESLVEKGHFITTWSEFMDYVNGRVEFSDMFRNAFWTLP